MNTAEPIESGGVPAAGAMTPTRVPPILLVVFNRPETTRRVLEAIRAVSPPLLLVASDGPRANVPEDAVRCAEARRAASDVDWECKVKTYFRQDHVGLAVNMTEAISWFLDQVGEGIILEDDCVPSPTFFRFCDELLVRYREVDRVMHISGDNFQYGRRRGSASYYFSRYAHCWGWASWRRAWSHFDFEASDVVEQPTVWAASWQRSVERTGGVCALPNVNLVTNIGFGGTATHTTEPERYAALPAGDLSFPLVHPSSIEVDTDADEFTYYVHFRGISHPAMIWFERLKDRLTLAAKTIKRRLRAGKAGRHG